MAYIKLNRENLYYNLNQLSLKSGDKTKIAAVLKDNAYGHGLKEMAKMVSDYGVQEAVVINQQEAEDISSYFKNILILNDTPKISKNFTYSITELSKLNSAPKGAKIELKVDTGMHRNGITLNEITEALNIVKSKELNLVGIFTHFKSADEFSSELAWQMANFKEVKKIAYQKGFKDIRFHSHNSAALLRSNSFNEDIARVGIAMYGFNEIPNIYDKLELKPVLSLWAKRESSRELKKGQRVGYGGDFIAPKDMVISTYDIGYGDGLFRGDSKNPLITAEGLKVLGRVSMDFISLESTKEEVCIINNAKITAKHYNTISYEITTNLSYSLKREIV